MVLPAAFGRRGPADNFGQMRVLPKKAKKWLEARRLHFSCLGFFL
jgi:hypothetical protein